MPPSPRRRTGPSETASRNSLERAARRSAESLLRIAGRKGLMGAEETFAERNPGPEGHEHVGRAIVEPARDRAGRGLCGGPAPLRRKEVRARHPAGAA